MAIYEFEGCLPRVAQDAWVAETAAVIGDVTIGAGSSVWFGVVVRADFGPIRIGDAVNVQDNSVIHGGDDPVTVIEDRVTIGHSCVIHSAHLETGCLVANGSIVLDGARIGSGALIAAGSVVTPGTTIAPGRLVAGAPAKDRGEIGEGKAEWWVTNTAELYRDLAERYRLGCKPNGAVPFA